MDTIVCYIRIKEILRGESMFRKSISLLIVFMLVFSTFVFAEEDNTITVEKAIELATADKSAIEDLDDAIEKLWDSYYAATAGKRQIESTLRALNDFEELYDKKYKDGESLSIAETYELEAYQMMFGKKPPHYTSQEMLDNFIKPRDFGYKAVYAEIQKLKNTKKTIEPSIEKGVRELYNQVVSLQSTLALQESYLEISTSQHDQAILKYQLGQLSAEELKVSELNLQILNMQIEQLRINLNTLEMNFNKLIDVNLIDKYVLTDTTSLIEDILVVQPFHKDLDTYISDGITNRSEVKNARIDYDVKEREDSIIKDYLSNELSTDRVNAELELIKATHNLEGVEADVKDNISDGYISMLTSWNDYLLSVNSYKLSVKNYDDMTQRFELGQITKTDLSLVEYQVEIALNTVESNVRNYLNSVDKMDKASGIGPAY